MELIRYSNNGFNAQYQDYHIEHYIRYCLDSFDISKYPDHLKDIVQEQHDVRVKLYTQYHEYFKSGIWCFIKGHVNQQSLNHITIATQGYSAVVPDDTIVVGCNWDKLYPITDVESRVCGFYIPACNMDFITDITRLPYAYSYNPANVDRSEYRVSFSDT